VDGFFDRVAPTVARAARTRHRMLGAVVWGAGVLSAVITNDAVCVLAAPLVVGWIQRFRLPRLPFLLALATGANTGSVATLVGNPQNMLCASLGDLSFRGYLGHMVPVAVLGLAINHAILALAFRRDLRGELELEGIEVPERIVTVRSAITLAVLGCTVALYVAGTNLTFTALAGFAALLVLQRFDPARIWERIDWSILLFFGGLFVAVDAFARSGAPEWAFARAPLFAGAPGPIAYLRTAAYFLVGSNSVTNVPFILVVRREMATLPDPRLGWELLAMAATFAGNLTLLGSVANVIVAEKARDLGGLRFGEYLRVGAPVALATTLVGTLWLLLVR
jgi:Na+/H+ antiporter NhaD/arsenite permease-like protein